MDTLQSVPRPSLIMEQIQASAQDYQSAKDGRIRAIRMARAEGLTYREIGEHLGMTDAAVIGLLKRAGGHRGQE